MKFTGIMKPRAAFRGANAIVALSLFASGVAWAAPAKTSVLVTLVEGQAELLKKSGALDPEKDPLSQAGPWTKIVEGARLSEGQAVRTREKSRVELELTDGSRVRLGPDSLMVIDQTKISKRERSVRLDLWIGRLWAKVSSGFGDRRNFDVRTTNAVAGVRGTSFTVVAMTDLSSVVRVYAGSVGVKPGGYRRAPSVRQVPGPRRVDQRQWEEVIATAMREVRVTSAGDIQPAESFQDEGTELEWAMWNQARDKSQSL